MQNNIKFPALTIFLFSYIFLHAQKSYELKLYNSMQYNSVYRSYPYSFFNQTTKTTQWLKLMPGISMQKGKSTYDLFITSLSHQNTLQEINYTDTFNRGKFKHRVTSIVLGCQLIKSWQLRSSINRLNYFLGGGIEPIFTQNSTLPYNSNSFKTRLTGYMVNAYIIPRLRYKLNEKLALELTIPVNLVNFSYQRQWVGNPSFSPRQQITQTFELNQLPHQVIVNFGVACKI